METLRVGVVGLGRIGVGHAATLAAHPRVGEVVVADVVPGRAEEVAGRIGVRAGSVEEVFDTAVVDALVITAGTATHPELLTRAAQARMPVFCEKPVGLTIPEARAAVAALEAAGSYHQIGFQRRFDAGYAEARRRIRAGELGEVRRLHLLTCDQDTPDPGFIPTSGGIFLDCLVHDFDIAAWLTGSRIETVYARGTDHGDPVYPASGDASDAVVLFTMADGTLGTAQSSRYNGQGHDTRAEIAGTAGSAHVGLDDHAALASAEPGVPPLPGPVHPTFRERFAEAFRAELGAFVDCVADGRPSPCPAGDALEALYVATAATLSFREGREVRVSEVRAS